MRKILVVVAVLALCLTPSLTFAKDGSGPGASAGGGNSGHGGGSSHGGGHGGGDGGNGGGHGHGGHGGEGGHGGHGGHGGDGGSTSGSAVSAPSGDAGAASNGGPTGVMGNGGFTTTDRERLNAAIRVCEMTRPGLALGDSTVNGGWSFRTYDDTVWPYVMRCMADHGYMANGADYRSTTNFGTR